MLECYFLVIKSKLFNQRQHSFWRKIWVASERKKGGIGPLLVGRFRKEDKDPQVELPVHCVSPFFKEENTRKRKMTAVSVWGSRWRWHGAEDELKIEKEE